MFNFNRLHAQVGLFDEPQGDQDLGCIPTVLLRFAHCPTNMKYIIRESESS